MLNFLKKFLKYIGFLKKTQIRLSFDFRMTQQNINIIKSSDKIKDSFISHFNKTLSSLDLIKTKF